jgi:hypothetical protein
MQTLLEVINHGDPALHQVNFAGFDRLQVYLILGALIPHR